MINNYNNAVNFGTVSFFWTPCSYSAVNKTE